MSKSNESFVNRVSLAPFLQVVGRDNAKRALLQQIELPALGSEMVMPSQVVSV